MTTKGARHPTFPSSALLRPVLPMPSPSSSSSHECHKCSKTSKRRANLPSPSAPSLCPSTRCHRMPLLKAPSFCGIVLLLLVLLFLASHPNSAFPMLGNAEWPTIPVSSRAFMGIRTLPSHRDQLKEQLVEQAEQRQAQMKKASNADELAEEGGGQSELHFRRQRDFNRLLCMVVLQSLDQCRDI